MTTRIRPELSEKNKYRISKHRHYELKHFCLQYQQWKDKYADLQDSSIPTFMIDRVPTSNMHGDPTSRRAELMIQT